jgi:hypothetical protein
MSFSTDNRCCEWCEAKEGLVEAETGNKILLLVCKDNHACASRWPEDLKWPEGRVGVPDGVAG